MTAPLLDLIADARRAGLVIARRADQLVVRGPRTHEPLVQALLDRKPDVLAVIAVYGGEAPRLDWRKGRILDHPQPCALCSRPTLLIEPYDQRPCHKGCAEAAIRWGTPAAHTNGGRAA
jgi:hypothetical protein